jgi:hypothetical protein
VLLKSLDHVISDQIALLFTQSLAKSPHELACPNKGKCDGKAQWVPSGPHLPTERKENKSQQHPLPLIELRQSTGESGSDSSVA